MAQICLSPYPGLGCQFKEEKVLNLFFVDKKSYVTKTISNFGFILLKILFGGDNMHTPLKVSLSLKELSQNNLNRYTLKVIIKLIGVFWIFNLKKNCCRKISHIDVSTCPIFNSMSRVFPSLTIWNSYSHPSQVITSPERYPLNDFHLYLD